MNEINTGNTSEISFRKYLMNDPRNRRIILFAAIAIVVQFAIFKYLYPFANFIHGDSFSYLETAQKNLDINTYMVGYSRFLRLFSVFTTSDTALAAFQYLFIQCSALFLLFTLFYFYKPGRVVQMALLCFMVFNPLFLHLANLISSDGFFLALSLLWFTLLLWIIHRPSRRIILVQAVVLFLAFTVRYNALIYPFISAGAFWLSRLPLKTKLVSIGAGMLLCGLFIFYTSYKYKQLTGYWQYSPFSGWQLANNAMYAYRYVNHKDRKPVPKKFEPLDNMIRQYFDSTRDTARFPIEKIQASTFYMWSAKLPLFKYNESLFKNDSTAGELKRWASMGPLYKEYGLHIIRKYPWHFARYFLLPNAKKYYAPPLEFLDSYNSGKNHVAAEGKYWFGYKSRIVKTRMKNNKVLVLSFYPILSGVINVIMFFTLLCYVALKGWQINPVAKQGVLLGTTMWILNAGFTIGASSAALRFQSFPIILTTTFTLILIDWLVEMSRTKQQAVAGIISHVEPDITKESIVLARIGNS